MPKRTFQPNRRHRSKVHGFRARMKTKAGAAVLPRLIRKGSRLLALGRQDATDAKLLSQCLLPLPLRCPRRR
jgi:large subunit ribosomal protein L34